MRDYIVEGWKKLSRVAMDITNELINRYYSLGVVNPVLLDSVISEILEEKVEEYEREGVYIDSDTFDSTIELYTDILDGQVFIRLMLNTDGITKEYGVYKFYEKNGNYSGVELTFNKIDEGVFEMIEYIDILINKYVIGRSNVT